MKKYLQLMVVLVSVFVLTEVGSANMIVNGGFETGDFTAWTNVGNTGFTSVSTLNPHSGTYAAQLGPIGSDGYLFQSASFATTIGDFYDVSFWLYSDGNTPNDFTASFINGTPATLLAVTNIPFQLYTEYQFTVLANATSSNLLFAFRNDPGYLFLDDVSVNPVPEPGTLMLLGFGMFGLAIYGKRRMSKEV